MARARSGAKTRTDPAVKNTTPPWMMVCSVGLSWLGAVATASLFVAIGHGLDRLATNEHPTPAMWALAGVLAIIAAASAAGGSLFSVWATARSEQNLRQLMVSRIFDLGITNTAGRSGELLSLSTEGVERTAQYRAGFLGPIIGAITTPLVVLVVMAVAVDPVTAGWLTALIVAVPLLIGAFQRVVSPIGTAYRRSQERLTSAFLESIQALETLVYARAARRAADRLAHDGEQHRSRTMRLLAGNQIIILVLDAAFSLTMITAGTAIAIQRVNDNAITVGHGVAVVLMTVLLVSPVDHVGKFFYIGIGGRASQRGISDVARAADVVTQTLPTRSTPIPSTGSILVKDVTAGWPEGPDVVENLTLEVQPGEHVALIGPSGVGKSTVGALLQAHLFPRAGTIIVDGLDTQSHPSAEVRSRLAVVEQRTFLFLGTIADNLRVARPCATDEQLWQALDLAGLRTEIENMPEQLGTPVGEHGMLLSGGQAQRLSIARAALRDAPIVILDEPTSHVDLAAETEILSALERLADGRTVLMIAHRPNAILSADRVIELTDPLTAGGLA